MKLQIQIEFLSRKLLRAISKAMIWLIQMHSLLLRRRMTNGTSTAKQLKIQHRSQRDAKQTKNSKVGCMIQVEYKD